MIREITDLSAMTSTDVFNVDAQDEHHSAANCQDLPPKVGSSKVYCNTALTIPGVPSPNHGLVLASAVNAMVQVQTGDIFSPHLQLGVSFPLAQSPDELVVAGPPVVQETRTVREVEIGPEITLGYHSVDDYNFIMNLDVIEEEQY